MLAGFDGEVELADLQVGGFANERHVGIVRERGGVIEPVCGVLPILSLLVEFGDAAGGIDGAIFALGLRLGVEFGKEVIDHLLAADDAGLLLERDGLILVLDEVAVGGFGLVPTTGFHRRGGGGILGSFNGGEVVRGDIEEALKNRDGFFRRAVFQVMLAEFVQGLGVFRRSLDNGLQGKGGDVGEIRGERGIF